MEALDNLTKILEEYLVKKAPALPANIKSLLVQWAPWVALVAVVLGVPGVLAFFGLGAMLYTSPYGGYMVAHSLTYTLAIVVLVVSLVVRGLSVPGLMKRTKSGWNLLYYSTLISAGYSLLAFDFVGLIVGTLVSLYLVFQVKESYK